MAEAGSKPLERHEYVPTLPYLPNHHTRGVVHGPMLRLTRPKEGGGEHKLLRRVVLTDDKCGVYTHMKVEDVYDDTQDKKRVKCPAPHKAGRYTKRILGNPATSECTSRRWVKPGTVARAPGVTIQTRALEAEPNLVASGDDESVNAEDDTSEAQNVPGGEREPVNAEDDTVDERGRTPGHTVRVEAPRRVRATVDLAAPPRRGVFATVWTYDNGVQEVEEVAYGADISESSSRSVSLGELSADVSNRGGGVCDEDNILAGSACDVPTGDAHMADVGVCLIPSDDVDGTGRELVVVAYTVQDAIDELADMVVRGGVHGGEGNAPGAVHTASIMAAVVRAQQAA